MDIAGISTLAAMKETGAAVGIAVTKMAMNMGEQGSAQMINMLKDMEISINPHLGANIDIKI